MKLQYLLGLEKFKASGQSLGNLKPPLQVRRYLMYTVCPIADRGFGIDTSSEAKLCQDL